MNNSFEKLNPELIEMLEGDLNLAIVFQYVESVILESRTNKKGLSHNGEYYVPDIMYRFTKALPFYSKHAIREHLEKLIELGFVIKEDFSDHPNPHQKTTGYRINRDLIRWEKEFVSLKRLSDKTIHSEKGREIKALVYNFMFKLRNVYKQ